MDIYLLAVLFFSAYFLQSIFGFGATILSLVLVSIFMGTGTFKEVVFLTVYTGIIAPLFVYLTDPKSLDVKSLGKLMLFAIPGIIIGGYLLDILSPKVLITIFSIFLIYYSVRTLIHSNYKLPKFLRKPMLFASGFMQGLIGVGGPFAVMGLKDSFVDKRNMRATFAIYFLLTNIVRAIQLYLQGSFNITETYSYRLIFIAVPLGSILGYYLHLKISNSWFNRGIAIILLLSGIKFLFF